MSSVAAEFFNSYLFVIIKVKRISKKPNQNKIASVIAEDGFEIRLWLKLQNGAVSMFFDGLT